MCMPSGKACVPTLFVNLLFAIAQGLLLKSGVGQWNISPPKERCVRSEPASCPHARGHTRGFSPSRSTRQRREGRSHGGFSGGGPTASQRKKYARGVNSIEERISGELWESDLVFTRGDLRDVVPYDNDPVVISVVTAGRKVHRVLVDQGSSADVMFWSTFNKLRLSPDL